MTERGTGRIINDSSIIGEIGSIGQANTPHPNPASTGSPKTLARESGSPRTLRQTHDDSIVATVNTVTPGYTLTEMVPVVSDKILNKIKAQIPVRRLGRPKEIARIVHFLAADASSYITDQVWAVNGGMDM